MKVSKTKVKWRWIGLIFLIVLMLVFGVRKFTDQLSKHELNREITRLADIAGEETRHTNEEITQQVKELEDISRKITKEDMLQENLIFDKIESTADASDFTEIGVSNREGSAVTSDGKVKNVDSFEFFTQAVKGENAVSAISESVDPKGEFFVIAVPIIHDKEIAGVVYGKVEVDKVLMNIDLNRSAGKHLVRIVDADGDYVLSSGKLPYFTAGSNAYLDLRECEIYDGFNEAKLRSQMSDNKSGYFSYEYNGEKEHVQFLPLGMNDWYVFSITSDETIRRQVVVTRRITFELCFKVFLCFVLILGAVVFDNRKNSRIMVESNNKLKEFSNILAVVLNKTKDIVFEYSPETGMIKVCENPRIENENPFRVTKPEELVSAGVVSPEFSSIFMRYIQKDIRQDHSELILKMRHTGEEYKWVKISTTGIYQNWELVNVIGFIRNYSKEKEMEVLYEKEKKYHSMLIKDAIFSCAVNIKEDRVIDTRCSQEWPFSVSVRYNVQQKVHPDYKEMVLHYTSTEYLLSVFHKGLEEVKYEFLRKNQEGVYIWVEMIERVYKDEKGDILALVVLNDIHERKEKEIVLSFKAQRDFLTTLYNREAFVAQMNDYLSYPDTESKMNAFILLDLDNFKNVNDTLGHDMGDKVLKDVAEIMKRKFRAGDLLGRLGGDEFVLLLKDVRSSEIVHRISKELGKMLELEYTDGTQNVKISASMGIALAPLQGSNFEELYLKADKVLYEVKKNTKNGHKIYGENEK